MINIKMDRKAFTMIELIFVIVIIGILAAVAIPKLAATRDDADVSAMIANCRTVVGDMKSYYTSQGNSRWKGADNQYLANVTDVQLLGAACSQITLGSTNIVGTFTLCDDTPVACIQLETTGDGNLTISAVNTSTVVCKGVTGDPSIQAMLKKHVLGGKTVRR